MGLISLTGCVRSGSVVCKLSMSFSDMIAEHFFDGKTYRNRKWNGYQGLKEEKWVVIV